MSACEDLMGTEVRELPGLSRRADPGVQVYVWTVPEGAKESPACLAGGAGLPVRFASSRLLARVGSGRVLPDSGTGGNCGL